MTRIANPLRDYVKSNEYYREWSNSVKIKRLLEIADQIDAENSRRMEQSRKDTRKAACKYMLSVINDYKHGIKRKLIERRLQ